MGPQTHFLVYERVGNVMNLLLSPCFSGREHRAPKAVMWALGEAIGSVDDHLLDDLGDPGAGAQVLPYITKKT